MSPRQPAEAILISVPTALGLTPDPQQPGCPRGTWRAPEALLDAGFATKLKLKNCGTLKVPAYDFDRDPASGIYNRQGIAAQTIAIAAAVGSPLARGERVVLLGGDCSILVGAALALRRRGDYGLVFIDGHLDFRHPGNSPRLSAAAGEELAIVTGRGLEEHAHIEELGPYFQDGHVLALGGRDEESPVSDVLATAIRVMPAERISEHNASLIARETLGRVRAAPDGFWIHLDVDVLDGDVMPAVDSHQPGGLSPLALTSLLGELWHDPGARGLDLTIYDPELDDGGRLAHLICEILRDALV